MSYIGQIRSYGGGLNFENLDLTSNILDSIFNESETKIFITTSGVINLIPEKLPFENFTPFLKTLLHPITRRLF